MPDNTKAETEAQSLPSKLDCQAVKIDNIILEAKLENNQRELEETKQKEKYARKCFTVANLSDSNLYGNRTSKLGHFSNCCFLCRAAFLKEG